MLDNASPFADEPLLDPAMTKRELERDVAFAVEIAEAAGERVLGLRASERWKEAGMLADIGDQAADGFIQGFIRGRHPDDGILSEETADSARRLAIERTWIIDPLDGTREYSQLREDWAVHVALTIGGKCALGVLALPARPKDRVGHLRRRRRLVRAARRRHAHDGRVDDARAAAHRDEPFAHAELDAGLRGGPRRGFGALGKRRQQGRDAHARRGGSLRAPPRPARMGHLRAGVRRARARLERVEPARP
jgi:hypothetical protein